MILGTVRNVGNAYSVCTKVKYVVSMQSLTSVKKMQ